MSPKDTELKRVDLKQEVQPTLDRWLRYGLPIAFVISLLFFLASLPGRTIHVDDAWFAEQAYWLAKDGVVRSEFFGSLLDYDKQQFVYHKLHIWMAAAVINIVGLSHYYIKLIPVVFFVFFLWVARFYFKLRLDSFGIQAFGVFVIFFLANGLLVEHVYVYRPEVIIMSLGFASYVLLRINKTSSIIFAGMLAGLCVLEHLNGLIFVVAGIVLLLYDKKYKDSLIFLVFSILVSSLYFIDVLPANWSEYWYQFRNDPALQRESSQFSIFGALQRVLTEYKRFFRHPGEIAYSLFFICLFWIKRDRIVGDDELKHVLIYFLILVVTLGAIAPAKTDYYLLYHMPYVAVIVSALFKESIIRQDRLAKIILGLAFLYLVTNIGHTFNVILKSDEKPFPADNQRVAVRFKMQQGDKVQAPLTFIFNGLEQFQIRGVGAYFIRVRKGLVGESAQIFFSEALAMDRKFILLEKSHLVRLGIPEPIITADYHGYRYLGHENIYYVFQRNE